MPPIAYATEVRDGAIIVHLGRNDGVSEPEHVLTRDGLTWEKREGVFLRPP